MKRFTVISAILTLAFCYGVAKNLLQPGGLPGEWVWIRHQLDIATKLKFPLVVFVSSLLISGFLVLIFRLKNVGKKTELISLIIISILAFLIQISVFSLGKYGFYELPIIGVNESQTSYLWDAAKIENLRAFLSDFPSIAPQLSPHSATHPPGPIVFFWFLRFLVRETPLIKQTLFNIGDFLKINYPYLSSIDALLREPDIYATSIFSGFLIPLIASLTSFPLYYLGKEHYNKNIGLYGAIIFMYIPSLVLFAPQMDQVFALFSVSIIASFYFGIRRKNLFWIFLSSVLFSLSLFFSLTFLGLLPMGAYLLLKANELSMVSSTEKPTENVVARFIEPNKLDNSFIDYQFLIKTIVAFVLPIVGFYILVLLVLRLDMIEVFRMVIAPVNKCISQRTYSKWFFYNLYDFFAFLGIPLFLLFGRKLVLGVKDSLFSSLIFSIFILDLLGKNRGEVARLWLFLVPFAGLVSVSEIEKISRKSLYSSLFFFLLLISLQFFQVLVFKTFLEMIAVPGLPFFKEIILQK